MFDTLENVLKKRTLKIKKKTADNKKACKITQKVSGLCRHCFASSLKKDIRLMLIKEARSVTMKIFRKIFFSF